MIRAFCAEVRELLARLGVDAAKEAAVLGVGPSPGGCTRVIGTLHAVGHLAPSNPLAAPHHLAENLGAVAVQFTPEELRQIRTDASKINIEPRQVVYFTLNS